MILSILFLALGIASYSISQLQQHGKLRWMKEDEPFSFWGKLSYRRKYKKLNSASGERWPTSTNITVFLTDGYHLCQFIFLLCISISVVFLIGFDWWTLLGVWLGIHAVHFSVYKLLSK